MRTVHKYTLSNSDVILTVPRISKVIHLEYDGRGGVNLWMDVDADSNYCSKRFLTFGTGREIPKTAEYVGTIIEPSHLTDLVWHIFEVPYD